MKFRGKKTESKQKPVKKKAPKQLKVFFRLAVFFLDRC